MFWSFMADVFTPDQGKRLFGFIAVGGSIGGIVGGLVTSSLAGS
jgi:ATP/ADP translocase